MKLSRVVSPGPELQQYTVISCGDLFLLLLPEEVTMLRAQLHTWNEYAELSPGTPYTTPVVVGNETFDEWQPDHDG